MSRKRSTGRRARGTAPRRTARRRRGNRHHEPSGAPQRPACGRPRRTGGGIRRLRSGPGGARTGAHRRRRAGVLRRLRPQGARAQRRGRDAGHRLRRAHRALRPGQAGARGGQRRCHRRRPGAGAGLRPGDRRPPRPLRAAGAARRPGRPRRPAPPGAPDPAQAGDGDRPHRAPAERRGSARPRPAQRRGRRRRPARRARHQADDAAWPRARLRRSRLRRQLPPTRRCWPAKTPARACRRSSRNVPPSGAAADLPQPTLPADARSRPRGPTARDRRPSCPRFGRRPWPCGWRRPPAGSHP